MTGSSRALGLVCAALLLAPWAGSEFSKDTLETLEFPPGLLIERGEETPFVIPESESLEYDVILDLGVLGEPKVGTFTLDSGVVDVGPALPMPGREAVEGRKGYIRGHAVGEYKLYTLDHTIEAVHYPQPWPNVEYRDVQTGSENRQRVLRYGVRDGKPQSEYIGDHHCGGCDRKEHFVEGGWFSRDKHCKKCKRARHRVWSPARISDIPARSLDMLSSVMVARTMVREGGESLEIPMLDRSKRWDVTLRNGEVKTITTPAGRFNCRRIKLIALPPKGSGQTEKFKGLFGINGTLNIWLEEHTGVMVMLEGVVPLGIMDLDVHLELTRYRGTPTDFVKVDLVLGTARQLDGSGADGQLDDRGGRAGLTQREARADVLVLALEVGEDQAGVEHERVGPRGHHAQVALFAVDLAHEARSGRDRIVVLDAQREQALVQAAVGVDLGDDLLADVATLFEAERVLEARLLRVDRVVDVGPEQGLTGLDAQDVARDQSGGLCPELDERAPGGARAGDGEVDVPAGRAGDLAGDDLELAVFVRTTHQCVGGLRRRGAAEALQHVAGLRSGQGERGPGFALVGELDVVTEQEQVESALQAARVGRREHEPGRAGDQVELVLHLAFGRQQQPARPEIGSEPFHVVRQDAVQEGRGLAPRHREASTAGLVEQQRALQARAVLGRNIAVGEELMTVFGSGQACTGGLVQIGQRGVGQFGLAGSER